MNTQLNAIKNFKNNLKKINKTLLYKNKNCQHNNLNS